MKKQNGISRRTSLKGLVAASVAGAAAPLVFVRGGWTQNLKKVSLFIGTTPHFANIIVGVEKGFFQKEGLDVQLTNFASGSVATEAFRAGRGNLVDSGDMPSLKLWGRNNVGVCPTARYGHLSVVVGRKHVKNPADVKGKKVGVLMGSTSEYFAGLWLASGNMTLKDIDIVNLRPAEMVTGLVRKDIDAFVIWQPFGWRTMAATDDAHIITTAAPFFTEWMITSTNPDFQKKRKDEAIAYCRGLNKASQWCNDNRADSAAVVAKNLKLKDLGLVRKMTDGVDWNIAFSPKFRKDMESLSKFAKLKLDWNTMFDKSILAEADPSLVQ